MSLDMRDTTENASPVIDLQQRTAGVLLHITSLPGPHGIGDFGPGAYQFVDWLKSAGIRLWQWLPTNPIGPGDSPYQSVSAFAGSPLMVALEPLIACGWLEPPAGALEFNSEKVEFAKVVPWRLAQLRLAEQGFFARADAAARAQFDAYRREQASWLDDYSLFMACETAHSGSAWWHWRSPLRDRNAAALAQARIDYAAEIRFWQFVQWCFDVQGLALKNYANQHDIAIMGDLPIFIAHHSADCWARPDLYYLDADFQPTVVAGCPPDAMAPTGQRWGNPLYRWSNMAAENYQWWSARLARALAQADVFRIDHFRGFAAYYEIPASCPTAQEGSWVTGPGRALFDAISSSLGALPIVAEDLGLITPDVLELRDGLGFPGMKILQFGFGTDGKDDFLPHNWGRNFVAYTGTHDNDTVRGWWQTTSASERAYAGTYLATSENDVHWAMIRACWNSVANIAVCQFQDALGLDGAHRMNVPGTLGAHNWTWRFRWQHVGTEPARVLKLMTVASGRGV
jgi:4-alpha-glucanotransferase